MAPIYSRRAGPAPLVWVVLAALTGFATSTVFSSWLGLERNAFVAAWAAVALPFLILYARRAAVRPMVQVRRRWPAGLLVGLLMGLVLAYGVQGQPSSGRPAGSALATSLLWLGVVYGALDALLLTVVPVLSVYATGSPDGPAGQAARLRQAGVALLAASAVAAAYHLGFAEFRGPALIQPLIGNGLVTLAYLLAGNPLAAILSHILMHVAAVLHGMATTAQLPPHY